jgi:hypothetical protein
MVVMDPRAVLGLDPDASEEEAASAYRDLAKRHHPDRSGDVERMREINAAYALLRDEIKKHGRLRPAPGTVPADAPAAQPGGWLTPALRLALGPELLRTLLPREPVLLVTDAATWDAHDVRLVVTDRRLVWLRDDALTDRIRSVKIEDVAAAEPRVPRLGRRGELRIEIREGRRIVFGEIRAELLPAIVRLLGG